MPLQKKMSELMIPLEDYPHVPFWFTLKQAMAIIREAAIKFPGTFEPRSVLVFDEKYQLVGVLSLGDLLAGITPPLPELEGEAWENLVRRLEADLTGKWVEEKANTPVSEVMSPITATVAAEDTVARALLLMVKEKLPRLPVMQGSRVVGLIRQSELFQVISDHVLKER